MYEFHLTDWEAKPTRPESNDNHAEGATNMNRKLDIAIIGAGMSGLFIGHKLKQAGKSFTIFEKGDEVGGTWRENTYPGLHVDVITRSYEFPFARSRHWSRRYAPGSEVRSYLNDVAERCDLLRHIRFGTELISVLWENGRWNLTSKDGATFSADVVYAGTGFLHRPVTPEIPGMETFARPAFHSARWDHSVDLDGRRIGVIGTGSSGIQIVSELGKRGHMVEHFMRTPQWIQVKENPSISRTEKALLAVPFLSRYWDDRMRKLKIRTDGTENWKLEPGPERDEMTRRFLKVLEDQVKDPVLREKLTPSYQLGCKRIPKSPDYYRVIQQDNVTPVFGPIQGIEPRGIIDGEGQLHELDLIVYATGFDSHAYMRPMHVQGLDGVTVDELWKDSVFSYRGVALPQMPNFFLLSGPFAPVNSLAIPSSLQDESVFLLNALDIIERDRVALAPTAEATQRFCDELGDAAEKTTYALCDNWYRDRGGVPVLWPWQRERHAEQFQKVNLNEFVRVPLGVGDGTRV
jgi:cation diffusion facilitator CzcD-associated flavoprotein CzcO